MIFCGGRYSSVVVFEGCVVCVDVRVILEEIYFMKRIVRVFQMLKKEKKKKVRLKFWEQMQFCLVGIKYIGNQKNVLIFWNKIVDVFIFRLRSLNLNLLNKLIFNIYNMMFILEFYGIIKLRMNKSVYKFKDRVR